MKSSMSFNKLFLLGGAATSSYFLLNQQNKKMHTLGFTEKTSERLTEFTV
jgi:hypothetical protein